mgnify:CR=1 FL=1
MANELEYAILSGILFFIVGNPITYGIVGWAEVASRDENDHDSIDAALTPTLLGLVFTGCIIALALNHPFSKPRWVKALESQTTGLKLKPYVMPRSIGVWGEF